MPLIVKHSLANVNGEAAKYLLLDNDEIYGEELAKRVKSMNIDEVHTDFRSPWQNPHAERVIGSVRSIRFLGGHHLRYTRQATQLGLAFARLR